MKLPKLKPRATPFVSSRRLPTLESMHDEKRLRGHALQERNRRLMQRNPLCVECTKLGLDVPVDEWDHEIPLWEGGVDDESNLQGLCFKHHKAKSEIERIRRARGRTLTIE